MGWFLFDLRSLTSASSTGGVALAANEDIDFICEAVASSALHMSRAVDRVSFELSRRDLVLLLAIPHTILSLIRLSVSSPNSQVFALFLRSVTY